MSTYDDDIRSVPIPVPRPSLAAEALARQDRLRASLWFDFTEYDPYGWSSFASDERDRAFRRINGGKKFYADGTPR